MHFGGADGADGGLEVNDELGVKSEIKWRRAECEERSEVKIEVTVQGSFMIQLIHHAGTARVKVVGRRPWR